MASPSARRSTHRSRPERALIAIIATASRRAACAQVPGATPSPDATPSERATPEVPADREPRVGKLIPPIATGLLEITVTDARGRRRAQIPVRIAGAGSDARVRTTDAEGRIREALAPGVYRVSIVAGCRGRMMVRSGGAGRVGLTSGQIVRAPLEVDAVRRYAAGPPLLRELEPPWPRGRAVRLAYRLFDRCTDEVMREFWFRDLAYRPSGHLQVVGEPRMRTDARGYAQVRVRCLRPGTPQLILGDPRDPADGEDLFAFTPPLDPSAEWCR